MSRLAYISFSKFAQLVVNTFEGYLPQPTSTQSSFPLEDVQDNSPRARFQVSTNDLKIISSALLHYKKFLNKRKDFDKAEAVAEVDNRIYNLILGLEKESSIAAENLVS